MPKALIFDFDGVIVMSEHARFQALQKIAARYGVIIEPSHFNELVGTTTKNFLRNFFSDIEEATQSNIQNNFNGEFKDRIIDHVTPIAPTYDFLTGYDGLVPLAVASGSDVKVLTTMLRHLGLYDKFEFILGKEHVTNHKPHPAVYLLATQKLRLYPSECVVIEDSVAGATAAVAAGIPVYILLNGVNEADHFLSLPIAGFLKNTGDIAGLLK